MKTKLLVAACASALNLSEQRLVIIPEGNFKGIDGRPVEAFTWFLTPDRGRQIAAVLNSRRIDMVIDYEHGTLKAQESGQPAPAAGWLKEFTYIEGVGLCSTDFKWTDKAQSFIDEEEYKYLSPVFTYTTTGEVTGLLCVALTNTPNIDELPQLLAAAAQDLFAQNNDEDLSMNEFIKLMLLKLGLAENATEAEVLTAANSLFTSFDSAFGTTLAQTQTLFEATGVAIATKAAANSQQTDLSKYVPISVVADLQAEIAKLNAAKPNDMEVLITAACNDGRLLGDGMKAWAKDLSESNPEALKAFLNTAPKIQALNGKQTDTIAANHQQQQKTNDEADWINQQFGNSKEFIEKNGVR
ncbi:phage protease [Acinetobacter modestus]|uniref:phage protease n=1 Tax=Acinetobacter modestus TaxID=1776740 RepID=UPI003018071D